MQATSVQLQTDNHFSPFGPNWLWFVQLLQTADDWSIGNMLQPFVATSHCKVGGQRPVMFQRDHLVTMHSSTALQLTHPHPIPSMAFPFRNSTTTHHSNRKNLRFCHGFGPLAATGPTAAGSCFPVPGTTAQPGAGVSTTCAAAPSGGAHEDGIHGIMV